MIVRWKGACWLSIEWCDVCAFTSCTMWHLATHMIKRHKKLSTIKQYRLDGNSRHISRLQDTFAIPFIWHSLILIAITYTHTYIEMSHADTCIVCVHMPFGVTSITVPVHRLDGNTHFIRFAGKYIFCVAAIVTWGTHFVAATLLGKRWEMNFFNPQYILLFKIKTFWNKKLFNSNSRFSLAAVNLYQALSCWPLIMMMMMDNASAFDTRRLYSNAKKAQCSTAHRMCEHVCANAFCCMLLCWRAIDGQCTKTIYIKSNE